MFDDEDWQVLQGMARLSHETLERIRLQNELQRLEGAQPQGSTGSA